MERLPREVESLVWRYAHEMLMSAVVRCLRSKHGDRRKQCTVFVSSQTMQSIVAMYPVQGFDPKHNLNSENASPYTPTQDEVVRITVMYD